MIKQTIITNNVSPGVNKKKYIILHHTATKYNSLGGVISWFKNPNSFASCHYVVDEKGEITQFNSDDAILWHAGKSEWKDEKTIGGSLNYCSIGIEII